jgi:hypothetical protein
MDTTTLRPKPADRAPQARDGRPELRWRVHHGRGGASTLVGEWVVVGAELEAAA